MLEFRLLGPFEARDGDRVLPVGRGKQTALLALLLLHANEVLSVDRLIDELWGERPTSTARKALQVYVVSLRKLLGAEAIVTRAPGYELRIEPEALDLRRFERLVDDARAALATGDANTASALLSDALALWRGPPLAELALDRFAQPEIARLDELRLAAIEERLDADLALGRHGQLVPELERLMAEHPVRERLRGQLMLALYRCGRQVDALDAYRAGRRTLVDELGIEPGPALQELQRLILVQDPSLAAPTPAEATVPPTVAEAPPPQPVTEERKLITVLCAACEGGAELEHDPERLSALFDRVRAVAGEEVEAAGGRLEQGAAGSVVASFGASAAHEDHAERAVHAALAVRRRLERLCGAELALGIGVETGEVVVGAREPGRPAIVGAPVGAASRLAATAAAGEVRLGARAAAAVGGAFELRARDGASLAVRALAVARPRGLQGLGGVFVGREAELELLRVTQERAVHAARPHVVAILGDAGVGKTSLVRALRRNLADDVRWYVGRCPAYGRAITYRPLAEVLRAHLGVRADEAPERLRARLADRSILGLTLGLEPDEELHPWEARRRLEEASVQLMDEIAAEGPAVVVLEDLHWAEDALLALLDLVARRASGPLLLLVTARPELLGRDPSFGAGRGNASRLWLEPLSDAESEQMLAALAGELPRHVRELVLGLGEGNPFFVEEALASLLDRGVLRGGTDRWVAGELPEALVASDSVQAVIAARIDVLPELERQALQAASVAGRSFWEGAVRSLLDRPDVDLELLEERDFVRRRARSSLAGELELGFKHALTREVAYASLTLGRRARLHASFADWLERIGGGRDEHAPLLAHHYARAVAPALADLAWSDRVERAAELRAKAVRWSRRAAELAIGRYEIDAALALLDEALALERDGGVRSELWRLVAWAHQARFDTDARRGALEQALALAPAASASAQILADLAHAGSGPWLWREPPPRELVEEWTARALGLAEPGTWAQGLALVARARADFTSGLEAARQAAAIAGRVGDALLESEAYQACAWANEANGALPEAGRWIDRTLTVLPRVRDPAEREAILFVAAFAYLRLGRIPEARRLAAEHDEVASRLSAHHEVHGVAMDVLVDVVAGDWQAARKRTARAEAACAANRDTPCQFDWRTLMMCALAQARLGDEAEAQRLEELSVTRLVVGGPAAREPALLRLALLRGDRDAVERLLADDPGPSLWDVDYRAARLDALVAVRDSERIEREAPALVALGGYVEPFALRALGLVRGERALVERAAERFDAMALGWRAAETRAATPPA
jgi:DNA-binding SARP family transcriptional activator/tetratricopeptide (TPR) repeat protein